MTIFRYAPELLARFPTLVGGVLLASDLKSGPTPPALAEEYADEQQAVLTRIGETPLSQIPALAAWRSVFRGFGVDPTQYRSAPEALLRRLTKKGSIPSINALVDLGNLVSIRYALPVALFDLRATQGAIAVRFADGSERYTTLGEAEADAPQPGEVVFVDETGLVVARRWCWRQSDESAVHPGTREALVTVEAHGETARSDVGAAQGDLKRMLATYAGGVSVADMLDATHPEFDLERR
ncbi:MAG TPA: phenylalanine--tRNA ligase beta subunit-related protein [Ktedonobacterales bacterium]